MQLWIDRILDWIDQHEPLFALVTVGSLLMFLGSLVIIPWLIVRLPSNYFSSPDDHEFKPLGNHPLALLLVNIVRTVIGILLIVVGIILLVLPGQGLLTIIIGLLLTRFPGKRRLVYWLVTRNKVGQSLNWIRRKAGKDELEMPSAEN